MDTTRHDLRILSICYYIMAGINGGCVFLAGGYILFFGAILANVPLRDTSGKGLPDFIPTLIAAIGAALVGFGLLSAACMAVTAWSLPKRRHYALIVTDAVLNCLQVPFRNGARSVYLRGSEPRRQRVVPNWAACLAAAPALAALLS